MPHSVEKRIRLVAEKKWNDAGQPPNQDLAHWLAAEKEVLDGLHFVEGCQYKVGRWLRRRIVVACLNFVLLAGCGGAVAWWIYRCTDWDDKALGIFSFGAFISAAALVFKLVPDDLVDALKKEIVRPMFETHYIVGLLPALFLLLFLISTFAGSLEIEAGKIGGDVPVWAYRPEENPTAADAVNLAANSRVRFPCWTTWSGRDYRIRVMGLPEKKVIVKPWVAALGPQRFVPPTDFLRPIVLVGADSVLINAPNKAKAIMVTLQIKVKHQATGIEKDYEADYDGRAAWIGCRAGDLDLPKDIDKEWAKALKVPRTAARLLPATALREPATLEKGDLVTIRLIQSKEVIGEAEPLAIRQPTGTADLIQVVTLLRSDTKGGTP